MIELLVDDNVWVVSKVVSVLINSCVVTPIVCGGDGLGDYTELASLSYATE